MTPGERLGAHSPSLRAEFRRRSRPFVLGRGFFNPAGECILKNSVVITESPPVLHFVPSKCCHRKFPRGKEPMAHVDLALTAGQLMDTWTIATYDAGWAWEGWLSSPRSSPRSSSLRTGPDATAGPEKVAIFARHNQTGLYLSAYLISLSILIAGAFLWYLRDVVAPSELGRRLANLGFAGGILFLVEGMFSAGAAFAMADVAKHADANVLQTLNIFSQDVTGIAGGASALLLGATSLAILRSKALRAGLLMLGSSSLSHRSAFPCSDFPSLPCGGFSPASSCLSHRNSQQSPATRSLI